MAAVQQLLDDITLRYRDTFKAYDEPRELFNVLELDSVPGVNKCL